MALPALLERIAALPAFTRLISTLPVRAGTSRVAGLHGSSDALLVAALSARQPTRLFVVLTDHVAEAERWLADLSSLAGAEGIALYPPREGFGEAEPHAEVAGERVETLSRISGGAGAPLRILVTTARATMERTRLPGALVSARLEVQRGDTRRIADLAAHLDRVGFERVALVEDVAQYAVRGGIVDVYSFGMTEPVRLEFWGDEVSELRSFDLLTQRSSGTLARAVILPVESVAASDELADERTTLPQLWPPDTLVVSAAAMHARPEFVRTWEEAAHHAELARRRGEDVVTRDTLFVDPDSATRRLGGFATLEVLAAADPGEGDEVVRFPIQKPEPIDRDMKRLAALVRDGRTTIILCDNSGQAERLDELLSAGGEPSPAALVIGVLGAGFIVPSPRTTDDRPQTTDDRPQATDHSGVQGSMGLRVLTDHEIFRRERRLRRARKYAAGTALETVNALKSGDFVVHLEHGVGIYRGMNTIFSGESMLEAIVIEYEGGDRLNVPLYRLDQIERYRAAADVSPDAPAPKLHKIGGKRWTQQREHTRAAIHEMTVELLDLYARRKVASRPAHIPDSGWQRQLESSFLFEDTPDQLKATSDVKRDMENSRPMDRLLVGDVGYGKTEIAVRAAFKAVQSQRQVAVLVPTTVLAEQHRRTLADRFADFPVRVGVLSRFSTAKEQAKVLEEVKAGTIDVIIGTHRLLSEDVVFKALGLIIVDEEHRFGVKHKERLKRLRVETDVLTLTATPIPRTLHLSLAGLRDMTLMQTPPRDRSPVLTFIEPWDDGLIEEGITRELDRGGQVYFVHNRIETIEAVADHVRRLVPRARIGVGHGKLSERALEQVMTQFVSGEIDVLVSTLIVESGLDVPNANTMFVSRADYLGLAQLYQLRGRVGRSHRRAYCYLMVPDNLEENAERRLKILEHHTELGAGYQIALKDMETRGAGNLLGPEQSGFVHAVGFDLYLRMLDETVRRVMRGDDAPPPQPADVTLDQAAYLPDAYIENAAAKLDVYRRLSATADPAVIAEVRAEVRDRFGALPPEAERYFALAALRQLGAPLGIEGILVRGDEARVNFRADALPRLKPLSAAFRGVQFQVDVRRVQPLSLKLTRLGGSAMLDGLLHALRTIGTT